MRLESLKERAGVEVRAVRSLSIDNESELDEKDLRICLQDHDHINSNSDVQQQL